MEKVKVLICLLVLAAVGLGGWKSEEWRIRNEQRERRENRGGIVSPLWKEYLRLHPQASTSAGGTQRAAPGARQLRRPGARDDSRQGTRSSSRVQAEIAPITKKGSASRQKSRTPNPDITRSPRQDMKSSLASADSRVCQSRHGAACSSGRRPASTSQSESESSSHGPQYESSLLRAAIQRARQEHRLCWETDESDGEDVDDHFIIRPTPRSSSTGRQEQDSSETDAQAFLLQASEGRAPRPPTAGAAAGNGRRMHDKLQSIW
jgi:hypothetical protein